MKLLKRGSATQRVLLVAIRGAWGATLVLGPDRVTGGAEQLPNSSVLVGARLLGARHLIEAALLLRRADLPPPLWSIVVDGLHGMSMLALAILRPSMRGVALRSGAGALALVALSAYEQA